MVRSNETVPREIRGNLSLCLEAEGDVLQFLQKRQQLMQDSCILSHIDA